MNVIESEFSSEFIKKMQMAMEEKHPEMQDIPTRKENEE